MKLARTDIRSRSMQATTDGRLPCRRMARSAMLAVPALAMLLGACAAPAAQAAVGAAAVTPSVAGVTSHKITLINGWKSTYGTSSTNYPAYSVRGGIVHLSGALSQPTTAGPVFAVLPKAIRPATQEFLPAYTYQGVSGMVEIRSGGGISAVGGQSQAFASLASLSYPLAKTARHRLTLINGWKSDAAFLAAGDPSYSLIGGLVCLSGAMYQPGSGTSVFTRLPAAIRPARNIVLNVDVDAGVAAAIEISPAGYAIVGANPFAKARTMTSLASICYPVNS